MFIRLRSFMLVGGFLAVGTSTASAQTNHAHIGLHALYNTTYSDGGIGAQFSAPLSRHLELYPSVDYYFQSPGTLFQANLDIKYRTSGDRNGWVYVGTGVNLASFSYSGSTDTHAGVNLFGGVESLQGNVHPFAEARATITDHTRFQMQAGVNFTLGSH